MTANQSKMDLSEMDMYTPSSIECHQRLFVRAPVCTANKKGQVC